MEIKLKLKFVFLFISMYGNFFAIAQEAEKLINLIEERVIIDYSKDTSTMIYGSTNEYNDSIRHCVSFVRQPKYAEVKPLLERLEIVADTSNLLKITDLTSKIIAQYYIAWESRDITICNTLWRHIPERLQQDSIINDLQNKRLFLILLKYFKNSENQVYREIMNRVRLDKFCYNISPENGDESDLLLCNRIKVITLEFDDLLKLNSTLNKVFYQAETFKYYNSLFKRKFKTWEKYISGEIKEFTLVNKLRKDSGSKDVDLRFIYTLIDIAKANESSE